MITETIKISKFAVKRATRHAAKHGGKILVRVPSQTGKAVWSAIKGFGKVGLVSGVVYTMSEAFKTMNRENYNSFTGDIGMIIKSAKNSVRD